jgi:hypothetical protein
MNGDYNLKKGPYAACDNVALLTTGQKFYFWCYVVNADNHKWVYGRLAGSTSQVGWMSDANLSGSTGALNRC